jgi:hypothetical protein
LRYARFSLSRQNPRLAAYGIRKSDRDVLHNTGLVLHRLCVNPLLIISRDEHAPLKNRPIHTPRGSAKEGSMVVSTVKDTRAATSSITKPRLRPILPGCP